MSLPVYLIASKKLSISKHSDWRDNMGRNLRTILITLLFVLFIWTGASEALVIPGPTLGNNEGGWEAFGLIIQANMNVTLESVRYPNQGLADVIELRRHSDDSLLTSASTPAGQTDIIVNINYPLTAGETYQLVATTTSNRQFAWYSSFPTSNAEISILASYYNDTDFWASFNDITTTQLGECVGNICYVPCTPGSCAPSHCTISLSHLPPGCYDEGQVTYCGCAGICPPPACTIYTNQSPRRNY